MQSDERLKSDETPQAQPKMRMLTWYKYVPHDDVAAYVAAGWEKSTALKDTHHGDYATLCVWEHDGEPPDV